jgi:hypothetical protein
LPIRILVVDGDMGVPESSTKVLIRHNSGLWVQDSSIDRRQDPLQMPLPHANCKAFLP